MTVRPVLACEVQLITWGESPDMGPWLKLRLDDPAHLELFRGLDRYTKARPGERFDLLLARPAEESGAGAVPEVGPLPAGDATSTSSPPPRQSHPFGQYARRLFATGFWLAPDVCRALGTDEGFLSWVRAQPCMVADPETCGGPIEAAHVRRVANGAGTGRKPEFSAVPLCRAHHRLQHQHGETAITGDPALVAEENRLKASGGDWQAKAREYVDDAKSRMDRRRAEYLTAWGRMKLEAMLNVPSIGDASPAAVLAWAERSGVAHLLPKEYREAA